MLLTLLVDLGAKPLADISVAELGELIALGAALSELGSRDPAVRVAEIVLLDANSRVDRALPSGAVELKERKNGAIALCDIGPSERDRQAI